MPPRFDIKLVPRDYFPKVFSGAILDFSELFFSYYQNKVCDDKTYTVTIRLVSEEGDWVKIIGNRWWKLEGTISTNRKKEPRHADVILFTPLLKREGAFFRALFHELDHALWFFEGKNWSNRFVPYNLRPEEIRALVRENVWRYKTKRKMRGYREKIKKHS